MTMDKNVDVWAEAISKNDELKHGFNAIGFSQGAAVCYECIMGIEKTLGGIFPIGGFLFKDSEKYKRVSSYNMKTPILIGHGASDDVIPIERSKIAYDKLLKEGANVKF